MNRGSVPDRRQRRLREWAPTLGRRAQYASTPSAVKILREAGVTDIDRSSDSAFAVCAVTNTYTDLVRRALPIGQWWELCDFPAPTIASVAANPTAGHPDPDGAKIVFVTRGLLEAWDMRLGEGGRDTKNVIMAAFGVLNYLGEVRAQSEDFSDDSLVRTLDGFGHAAVALAHASTAGSK